MRTHDLNDVAAYREKLQSYSMEELEDVYFHIHVLRQPLRYNMVRRELEARRLHAEPVDPVHLREGCLRDWLAARRLMARHPWLLAPVFSVVLFLATTAATFVLLLPVWLFAIPFNFLGLETAIVYVACAPIPPILAAGFGGRLGGRGVYGVWVFAGVVAGMLLFNLTGAPAAILRSVVAHTSGGGISFGGF